METIYLNQTKIKNLPTYSSVVNGKELTWGPDTLDSGLKAFYDQDYSNIAEELLGDNLLYGKLGLNTEQNLDQIRSISSELLQPFLSPSGEGQIFPSDRPSIMMHWANRASAFMETDKLNLLNGKIPGGYDINIADRSLVMTQTGNKNKPGDIVVQRGQLINNQLKKDRNVLIDESNLDSEKVKIFDAANLDYYHSSDALLVEAQKYKKGEDTKLGLLVEFIANNPESLLRIYASDTPTQLLLLYLLQEARKINPEVKLLNIEANSPEVSSMNRKDIMYPNIEDVDAITYPTMSVKEQLLEEANLSELGQLGFYNQLDILKKETGNNILTYAPGYTVTYSEDKEKYINNAVKSAIRLKEIYKLEQVCFKWATTSDGENIVPQISIDSEGINLIKELAAQSYDSNMDIVIVSNSNYLKTNDKNNSELTPSVHILGGYPIKDQITNQIMNGRQWVGNGILTKSDFIELAGTDTKKRREFSEYFDAMMLTNQALSETMKEKGMAMVGNDLGIFQLGGVFGDETFVAIQDNNWRFTGAFLAYASQELAKDFLGDSVSTNTRVINVTENGSYDAIKSTLDKINMNYNGYAYTDIITITPGWSMIYISTTSDQTETTNMMDDVVVMRLKKSSLII